MGIAEKRQQNLTGVKRLLLWQFRVVMICAVTGAVFAGIQGFLSALIAGVIAILPNAYFAKKLFKYYGAKAAKKIVNSFYKGEAAKIILSTVLFALAFSMIAINPIVFFMTYIMVQIVFWFAPVIFDNKQNRPKSD